MVYYKINIDDTEIYIPKYQTPLDLNLIPELYNRLATLDIGVLILTKMYKQATKKYRTVYVGFTDGYDTVLVLIPEYLLDKYKRITVVLEDIKRIKFYNKLEENIKLANKVIDYNLKNRTNINQYINLFNLKILIKSLIVSEFMKLNGIENYQLKYKKVKNDIITFIKISELKLIRLDPLYRIYFFFFLHKKMTWECFLD